MLNLTPSQKKTIACGVTVLALSVVVAFTLLLGMVFLRGFEFLSPAVTPLILGVFLAMFFKPYYVWWREKVHNPTLALMLMLTSVLIPLGLIVWFGGSFVVGQAARLVGDAPSVIEKVSRWAMNNVTDGCRIVQQLGAKPDDLWSLFFSSPERFSKEFVSMIGSAYGASAVKVGFSFLSYLMNLGSVLVTLLFFVFFLMRPSMTGADCTRELPFLKEDTRAFIAKQLDAFFDILVSFFQRQVIICLVEGLLYGFGFVLVGLPYGFVIGFLLGVLNLIPLFGTVTCLPLALPIAYFNGGGAFRLWCVVGVWLIGQILDGYLITPKIQGEKTGLGYAGVIFSFFFWGVVFHSLFGLLLAIPLSAFCVVLWRAVKERYIHPVI